MSGIAAASLGLQALLQCRHFFIAGLFKFRHLILKAGWLRLALPLVISRPTGRTGGLLLGLRRRWQRLFHRKADLALVTDGEHLYLNRLPYGDKIPNFLYKGGRHLRNMNHSGFALRQIDKHAEFCDSSYFSLKNCSYFKLHKDVVFLSE